MPVVPVSGARSSTSASRDRTDASTPVVTEGIHRSGTMYSGSTGATPDDSASASARVSSSAACNRPEKSSRACSASSSEMSPRRTSDSV